MRRSILAAAATALTGTMLAFAWPASASGDYGCDANWSLVSTDLDCESSIVLSPGNDTRVNLALLLRDRGGLAARPGTYPKLDWETSYARNFFDWGVFSGASYPETPWLENDYYGSRCVSLKGGDEAFNAAVAANGKVKPEERAALVGARNNLAPICSSFGGDYWLNNGQRTEPPALAWPTNVASKPGKEFLDYLVGAAAFYGEDWAVARSTFATLSSASDPWVKETARYMLARVDLNAAQAGSFDEWGFFNGPESVDTQIATRGGQALASYLKTYPKGLYAASAKGLERRALWLGGDLKGLADAYEAALTNAVPGSALEEDLIEEIDNKLLLAKGAAGAIDTPYLLATMNLMRMRASEAQASNWGPGAIDESELAAQEPLFARHQELYAFLRATYSFYVKNDAKDVLRRIDDTSTSTTHSALDFSRQILRGQALAAVKDPGEEAFWRRLISGAVGLYQRPTAELGLALHWEHGGKLAQVFAQGSPVQDSMIRKILLGNSASAEILRATAKDNARPQGERDMAAFTLLYKELAYGRYSAFGSDLTLVSSGATSEGGLWNITVQDQVPVGLFTRGAVSQHYACPTLKQTAAALAANPRDVKGQLCLGDFYRLNGFDDFMSYYDKPSPGTLGSGPSLFTGTETPRAIFYNNVIANPAATKADKSYALYRAVMCYAPSGNNTCGGTDVAESQRKAWFDRLKREYSDTRWARELKYYW